MSTLRNILEAVPATLIIIGLALTFFQDSTLNLIGQIIAMIGVGFLIFKYREELGL